MRRLTIVDHDRDIAGMTYVYPVVSRRAGGVSIGVNLNPNNACNWRCVYCQVPGLIRGKAPRIDVAQLRSELDAMLHAIVHGDFMTEHVPDPEYRRLNDVALSGNGEPTSAAELEAVMTAVRGALERGGKLGEVKVVMITNGSLAEQPRVSRALTQMAAMNGEVWFKLDRATKEGLQQTNSVAMDPEDHLRRLEHVAGLCRTFVQTCMFARDGQPPSADEVQAYLSALSGLVAKGVPLAGVLLYGLARESHQPEAEALEALPEAWLQDLGDRIRALGLTVKVTP